MAYVLVSFLLFVAGGTLGFFTAIDWFTFCNIPDLPSFFKKGSEKFPMVVMATSVSYFKIFVTTIFFIKGHYFIDIK